MEKATTTPNRLTRSKARNTPSKKSEDSFDLNPAEELKLNLRKSRRKTETKLSTNGDSSNDVDAKKLQNCDEISEGNSFDGCDSEDSCVDSVLKNSSQSNKTSSPTISRKSLRPRRSITPGPEVEPSVTKKLRRSTSESKLDSVNHTTNRRHTRAQSESKDFVFSPSKNDKSDYENSYSESNSKYIPTNSALRVIDKIIEEDNELEPSHESPKTSHPLLKKEEVDTDNNLISECDKKEDICQNKSIKSDSNDHAIAVSVANIREHLAITEEVEGGEEAVSTPNKTNDHFVISADSECVKKPSNQLSTVEEVDATQETINDEVHILSETDDQSSTQQSDVNEYTPAVLVTEVSDHLPIKFEAQGDKYMVGTPSEKHDHLLVLADSDYGTNSNKELSELEEVKDSQGTPNQEFDSLKKTGDQCSTPQPESNEYTPAVCVAEVSDHLPTPEEAEYDKNAVYTSIETQDHSIVHSDSDCVSKLNNKPSALEEVDASQETTNQEVDILQETCDQLSMTVSTEPLKRSSDQLPISEETESAKETSLQLPLSEEVTNNELSEEATANLPSDDKIINNLEESNCHAKPVGNGNTLNNDVLLKNNQSDGLNNKVDESLTKCIEIDDQDSENELHKISHTKSITKVVKATNDNCSLETSQLEISTTGPENVPMTENNNVSLMLEVESENEDSVASNQNSESLSGSPKKSLKVSDTSTKFSQGDKIEADENSKLKISSVIGSFEDKDSASESELYKNMSDFGSDVDEKKDGSQYGDSVSSELRTGDSEEYVSSFEEEDDDEEETNNEDNQPSKDQGNLENVQNSDKNTKMAENVFDNNTPMTYDKALAMINKNRVKKIDDEEFFDLFTQELNKVSEESGSDSDIAIVDEYIAEPEEKQQNKSNQKPGNSQTNGKNVQRPAPSNSISQRPMPPPGVCNQQIPIKLQRINLKSSQKSKSSLNSMSNNCSGIYNQQAQTEHSHPNMARMTFSQGGLYHQYNQGMPSVDSNRGLYDQFAPPSSSMEDPRMFYPHHVVPDNFSRGGMFGQPLGPVSDAQMQYSNNPLSVRNIDTMCGPHPSNIANLNLVSSEQAVNSLRNVNENDRDRIMGVSASTMTESGEKQEQGVSYSFSSKKADAITSPILEILGLDKKKLKMLKNVLGLDESREKQRTKIKQILIEEAHKMGLSLKSPAKIKNKIQREQKHSSKSSAQMKAGKKDLVKQIVDSDSDICKLSLQSHSIHSSEESGTRSEHTSSVSKKYHSSSESSFENKAGMRTVNFGDGGVCVRIETRPKRKLRHRSLGPKHIPLVRINNNEQKRSYQSCESSNEEDLKEMKKKKLGHKKKMTQGKAQNKKHTTVLQSNCGTFTVDPVTSTSQSESETTQEESSKFREEQMRKMKEELAIGKNKLSNMFRQHSLRQERKSLKRKADSAFDQTEEMEPKATKSKRLPAELLAKLGGEEKEPKRWIDAQTTNSESEELLPRTKKPRKRANSKKLKISSIAAQKHYIPLVVAGPTQFGLQRLDKEGTFSAAEKAAKFRTENLYGSPVKRITIMDFEG